MAACLLRFATGLLLTSTAFARQSLKVKAAGDLFRAQIDANAEEVILQSADTDPTVAPVTISETELTNASVDTDTSDTVANATLVDTSDLLNGRVYQVWALMDTDGDGIVNNTRFVECFSLIQAEFLDFETIDLTSNIAMNELFTYLDTDGSGYISLQEWVNGMGQGVVSAHAADSIWHPENQSVKAIDFSVDVHDGDDGNWIEIAKDFSEVQEYDKLDGNVYCEPFGSGTAISSTTEAACMQKCTEDSYCNAISFFLNPDAQQCWMFHTCYTQTTATSLTHSWQKASVASSGAPAPAPPPAPPPASFLTPVAQSNGTKAVQSNLIQGDGTVRAVPSSVAPNSMPSRILRQQLPQTPAV